MDATPSPSTAANNHSTVPVPNDLSTCQQMIRELLDTLHARDRENEQLQHRLDQLLRRLYGPRAERVDPGQLLLFASMLLSPESAVPAARESAPSDEATNSQGTGHGRRRLPRELPRRRVVHDLPEAERVCPACGNVRTPIGQEVSEQLDYQPASVFVVEHVRITYACSHCHANAEPAQVETAPKPPPPLERALPGPGLLAQVIVDKYVDHLPLNRQEHRFERQGVLLARSTLCDWMAAAAILLLPLYQRMTELVLQSRVIQTDDTPVPVQDPDRNHTRQGHLWVYRGDRNYPYLVFDYTPTRSRDGPEDFVGRFHGFLQADAYSGYDAFFTRPVDPMIEVGCWAHARRGFWESRTTDPARAHVAIAWIRRLYDVEERVQEALSQDAAPEKRDAAFFERRQAESVPLLADFRRWLVEQHEQVLPKSPVAQAIGYALNHWTALLRYTEHGSLDIDNNACERELRKIGIGRNYAELLIMRSRLSLRLTFPANASVRLRIIRLQAVEELQQLLLRLVTRCPRRHSRGFRQHLLLHPQVRLDVLMRRLRALMAQPQCDNRQVYPGLQQVHRRRVPNRVR